MTHLMPKLFQQPIICFQHIMNYLERCNTSYGVFTESGRKQLINAFSKHASSKSKNHVGVYTCGKYYVLGRN